MNFEDWYKVANPTSWSYRDILGEPLDHSPRSNPRLATASANVNPLDDITLVSGNTTMTLETAIGCGGRRHTFVKTDATNTMTIAASGTQTIDGAATISTTSQYGGIVVISDGTNWNGIRIPLDLLLFLQSGTGAVSRNLLGKIRESISVTDFGATGDGVTDDTAAIQNAINYVQNIPNGMLYVPPNVTSQFYRVSSRLLITSPIKMFGANPLGSTIQGFGMSAGQNVIDIDGTVTPNLEYVEISNLTVMSNNDAPDLISVNRASNSRFSDIGLRNARNGIVLTGNRTFSNLFERVIHTTGAMVATVNCSTYTGGGQLTFVGCSFGGTRGFINRTESAISGISFLSCNFEQASQEAILSNGDVQGLTLHGCRFEKNQGTGGAADILIDPGVGKFALGVSIHGSYFETDNSAYAIQFGGTGGEVRGFSIMGNYGADYTTNFVRLNGEGDSGLIIGNRLTATSSVVNALRTGVVVLGNENDSIKLTPLALTVPNGGTGLTGGISGGVPAYTSTDTISSSALLTQYGLMLGGGANAVPSSLTTVGTSNQVLHGNSSHPFFAAVNLSTDMTGILRVPNGGTGRSSGISGGIPAYTSTDTISSSALLGQYEIVVGGGANAVPASIGTTGASTQVLHGNSSIPYYGPVVLTSDVTGVLTVPNGGTGLATLVSSGILLGRGTGAVSTSLAMTAGQLFVGQGSGDPIPKAMSGDATFASTGVMTLATVNSNAGTFGSVSTVAQVTVSSKGLATAVSSIQISAAQLTGTTAADAAAAGNLGQLLSGGVDTSVAVTLTTDTPINVTSVALTAGDWDVTSMVAFKVEASTLLSYGVVSMSLTSATLEVAPSQYIAEYVNEVTSPINHVMNAGPYRVSLGATSTVYMVVQAGFSISACSSFGIIRARRMR